LFGSVTNALGGGYFGADHMAFIAESNGFGKTAN
jgi:hypothetical protein